MYVRTLFKIARILGVSQQSIADRLGVSHSMVSHWARGRRGVTPRYLHRVLQVFGDVFTQAEAEGTLGAPVPGKPQPNLSDIDFRQLLLDWRTEYLEMANQGPSDALWTDLQALCARYGEMDRATFREMLRQKDSARQHLYDLALAWKQRIDQLDRAFTVEQRAVQTFIEQWNTATDIAVSRTEEEPC